MKDEFKGVPLQVAAELKRAATAHEAVRKGIATHVEKERVKREAALHARRQHDELSAPLTPNTHAV